MARKDLSHRGTSFECRQQLDSPVLVKRSPPVIAGGLFYLWLSSIPLLQGRGGRSATEFLVNPLWSNHHERK